MRLIKLTLDETIQEQNSLLDGSAIHNRLKYLGLLHKPTSSTSTFNTDKIYPTSLDFDSKYKYMVVDDLGIGQNKRKNNINFNDIYSSNYYDNYGSNYKPRTREFSSSVYDNQNNSFYTPKSFKKCGRTMNFCLPDPQEYQVYYFPTSKALAQYPRQTTERFYRRKPVKQYPVEEVPYWPSRYPKPVRVIEREPSYSMTNYGYRNTNDYRIDNSYIEPYASDYRSRHYPSNDNINHGYDDNYYYEPDLRQRSYSSITRPCSPVYSRENPFNSIRYENSGSLLEKKIRDYVWNPQIERVEKYVSPNYEKNTYYNDFKPLLNTFQGNDTYRKSLSIGSDSQVRNKKNELTMEDSYKKNPITMSPEKLHSYDENSQLHKDDDLFSERTSYKKKSEIPTHFQKRISFDLANEPTESPDRLNFTDKNANDNYVTKEHKIILGRRESNSKVDDKRRASLLSNDNHSISNNKQRVSPSDINENSRRQSLTRQERLASIGNSLESDRYLKLKENLQEDDLNLLEENERNYNNTEKGNYDRIKDDQFYQNKPNEKNNGMLKNVSNINSPRDLRRDSSDKSRKRLSITTEKPHFGNKNAVENISNKRGSISMNDRRASFKDEQKSKQENIFNSRKNSRDIDTNLEKEYNNYKHSSNESSNNSSSVLADHNNDMHNVNSHDNNEKVTHNLPQIVSNDRNEENQHSPETYPLYRNDADKNTDIVNSNIQDHSDDKTKPKGEEQLQDVLSKEYTTDTNYYQDHSNYDEHPTPEYKQQSEYVDEHPTPEYEQQPEYADEHVPKHDDYYPNEPIDTNNEIATNSNLEPIQPSERIDEISVSNEYYYENPTDVPKENPTEELYENSDPQENNANNQPTNDDYYYQNNYDNVDSKEQQENQYPESGHQGDYVAGQDDYYYQDHTKDEVVKEQVDQQYVDPNYQGNYDEQQHANDDYYYQNYSDVDAKGHTENQFAESNNQGEYVAEQSDPNGYYYQNQPKEGTNEDQVEQHYTESEHQGDYSNDKQDGNYYYEDNSNVNPERLPTDHYDEHTQQEGYVDDQHMNDGYYYQKPNDGYDESIPKEQYDDYVDNQNEVSNSYYDPQQNYENSYQTQQSEFTEQPLYEQNPNNENYSYPENTDESQPTNQISNEQPNE